jgi:hypothetical protein
LRCRTLWWLILSRRFTTNRSARHEIHNVAFFGRQPKLAAEQGLNVRRSESFACHIANLAVEATYFFSHGAVVSTLPFGATRNPALCELFF